jgi:hypothetical protein
MDLHKVDPVVNGESRAEQIHIDNGAMKGESMRAACCAETWGLV